MADTSKRTIMTAQASHNSPSEMAAQREVTFSEPAEVDLASLVADAAAQIVPESLGLSMPHSPRDKQTELFDIGLSLATIQPPQRKSRAKASLHTTWSSISRCRFGYTPRHWASIRNQILCDHVHCEIGSVEGQPPQ